jgi:hypothetical protein
VRRQRRGHQAALAALVGHEVEDTRAGPSWALKPSEPAGLLGQLGGLGQMANGPKKRKKWKLNFEIDF